MHKKINSAKNLITFEHEMINEILRNQYSKKMITQKTGISISSIRRILLGNNIALNWGQFRKLLYLFCFCITQSASNSLVSLKDK